jgi:hypothetical protein
VRQRIAGMHAGAGEGCLVFLTSHGSAEGLALAAQQEVLTPTLLNGALLIGCAERPTVVIVSTCSSGSFVDGIMARPNRIILTAARADRTSFDCGAEETYTYFDGCLFAALPDAADWQTIFTRTKACVADKEAALNQPASEPQARFGSAVARLATLWPPAPPAPPPPPQRAPGESAPFVPGSPHED